MEATTIKRFLRQYLLEEKYQICEDLYATENKLTVEQDENWLIRGQDSEKYVSGHT